MLCVEKEEYEQKYNYFVGNNKDQVDIFEIFCGVFVVFEEIKVLFEWKLEEECVFKEKIELKFSKLKVEYEICIVEFVLVI